MFSRWLRMLQSWTSRDSVQASKRGRGRKALAHRFRSLVEQLETRLAPALTVTSFNPIGSGFVVQFNRPADASVLNLYDTYWVVSYTAT